MQASAHPVRAGIQEQITAHLPLLWFALFFLAGIVLGSWINLPVYIWLILTAAVVLFAIGVRHSGTQGSIGPFPYALIAVYLMALFLGAARYQLAQPKVTPSTVSFYNDRQYDLLVTGWVADMPDRRDAYTNLRIRVEAVDSGSGDYPVGGLILVRAGENETYHYGDRLRLRGQLKTPPEDEDFSYRDYLARQGIYSYMTSTEATLLPGRAGNAFYSWVYAFKETALERVYRLFPDPEASLLAGILLGVDTGLTRGLQDAFQNTGTSHIIAISGFNMSIIAAVFVALFSRWMGRRWGAALAMVAILFYTLLVGASPAVVRAALMGGLALFARQVGRRNMGLNTLSFVALLMAAFSPLILWDVGFQLSFFATLGLILYAEPLAQLAGRFLSWLRLAPDLVERILPPLSDFVLLTLAAQITVFPIIGYHFQRFSLISLLVNPFILPVQPAVMIIGGLALLLSLVIFPLGQLVAWLALPFVVYTIRMVEFFNSLPAGTLFFGKASPWLAAAFYILLFGVTFSWTRVKESFASMKARIGNLALTGLLIAAFALVLLVWRSVSALPDGQLHLTFLNVGTGDAVLVQTPSGRTVLVNGGPSAAELSDDLGRRLPLLRRKLDWLVVASTAENEMAALPRVLDRYPPQSVLWSGRPEASFSARQVDSSLAEAGIPVAYAEEGQRLDLGDGAFIEVQAEGPRGSVLLIQWREFRALLPLGMDADTLQTLEYGKTIGPVNVLLLADSGYSGTNNIDWVANLHPQLAVLSVAAGDPDGLPDREALESVAGYPLLRTDRNGWIEVSSDGATMSVEAERQ